MKRNPFKGAFSFLQKIGKALMLPVAVLPIAGLLLGIGAAPLGWMPETVSHLMRASGDVIFANMPLLFAVAVALGFSDNDGVSAVAAVVGYTVMVATLAVMAKVWAVPAIDTGVFGGILSGAVAAFLFKRFHRITLPPYLGFFAGKRFVPIITAVGALALGLVLSIAWPPVQRGIGVFSHWAAVGDPRLAATVYGFVERLLIPFGLHHIWNAPFFYEIGSFTDATGKVVHGDIQRYFSGDPTAGILGGAYLFKMFGLPAAAVAIWRAAKPENRKVVGGMMLSAALTSALTGITEPIEFAFLFVAPELYFLHAVLAASAQFLMATLGGHLGFTFSQGGIDLVLFNALSPYSQRWWLVLVLGPPYAALYYVTFRAWIAWRHLETPGREGTVSHDAPRGAQVLDAFGGAGNLVSLDACITRLRATVRDARRVDARRLERLGASGVLVVGDGVQAVFGPQSEALKAEIDAAMKGPRPLTEWLGGDQNVKKLERVALTRLRVELADASKLDEAGLRSAGVAAVMRLANGVVHLIVGAERAAVGT